MGAFIAKAERSSGFRETLINALEAGATRTEYGIEWQAVENLGVYRRVVAEQQASRNDCAGTGEVLQHLRRQRRPDRWIARELRGRRENLAAAVEQVTEWWWSHGVDGEASMIWVYRDAAFRRVRASSRRG